MIVPRRLSKIFTQSTRTFTIVNRIQEKISSFLSSEVIEKPKPPKLIDIIGTLKNINYRYDYPQNLTKEQKEHMKRFDVFRYDPMSSADPPHFVSYYIDLDECGPMFLDALIKIKDEIDSTLTFRRSCREGICGSCSMNIDGRHNLACIAAIPKNNLEKSFIAPLTSMNVLRDLVVDMSNFYNQYKVIQPHLKRKTLKQPNEKEYHQSIEERAKIDGLYECVLCLSCSSSCPSYWWHSNEYLGPAILQQAFRWVIDSRDEYKEERLEMLGGDMKLDECFQVGVCSLACPKGLDPRKSTEELQALYKEYERKKARGERTIQI
uniref:Succinate dehydrogenase [ubiquinone] iron-sulfur subunit, mitochondrial n=2 Tax=Nyctotherus ovalis TaxID=70075 RepID=Q5DM51_NYCOV|nr:hydrogenosomal succinate dehydrogenase beta subunit [Nyctotherus ovalis]